MNLHTILKKIFFQINEYYTHKRILLLKKGLFSYIINNRGYMLVIVLIISTLLISLSSEFLLTARINTRYMLKLKNEALAEEIAKTGLNLATALLKVDSRGGSGSLIPGTNTDKNIDTLDDIWAINFPKIPFDDGEIKIEIHDQQSKINLSLLSTEYVTDTTPFYGITQRILTNMNIDNNVPDSILDWVDTNNSRSPMGAETSDYYSTLPSPYEAKNGQLDSIDELLMIKNITPEIFYGISNIDLTEQELENMVDSNNNRRNLNFEEFKLSDRDDTEEIVIGNEKSRRLSDYFRVNGDRTDFRNKINKININTASFRVLTALHEDMTEDIAREMIRKRIKKPFNSAQDASEFISDENTRKNLITVRSELFLIKATGYYNNYEITIHAIYNRSSEQFLYYIIK